MQIYLVKLDFENAPSAERFWIYFHTEAWRLGSPRRRSEALNNGAH
jgi:hypothetical protein